MLPSRKLRSDSTWNRLDPEQIGRLDDWLFEEKLSYAEILRRLAGEFQLKASRTSLSWYFRRRTLERQGLDWVREKIDAAAALPSPAATNALRAEALKRVGAAVTSLAVDKPEELAALISVTKLLLASERNDLLRTRVSHANLEFHYKATSQSDVDFQHFVARTEAIQYDTQLSETSRVERFASIRNHVKLEQAHLEEAAESA